MIELNRLRSIKSLENIKKDLDFFVREPIIKEIYLYDYKWGEEDLEADREAAIYLIERINARIKSLEKMKLNPPKGKGDSRCCKQSATKKTACEGQSSEECAHDSYKEECTDPSTFFQ